MKNLRIALGLVLASAAAISAQEVVTPRFEIGLNYSGLHVKGQDGDKQRTGNGGSGSFEWNVNKVLGVVADFGGYANTRVDGRAMTYLFGPRFNWRTARLTPYVQFLFGGAYLWTDLDGPRPAQTYNSFAFASGGGIDYNLTRLISIKPVQVEYIMTQFDSTKGFGSRQNDVRYSAGVSLKFGRR